MLRFLRQSRPNKAIIAHNIGAFYPAVRLAIRKTLHLQIDVEDYHLGEAIYFNPKYDIANRHRVMTWTFSKAHALSFASKGIQQVCKETINWPKQIRTAVITNAFRRTEFVKPEQKKSNTIKLVWFSQNINPGRGLEDVFSVARQLPDFEFHIIGKANPEFINTMQPSSNVIIHTPMPQETLHRFLSTMDIGLALENPEADGNRNWCLTNKLLAYVQAGLYVLATDTYGQRDFLNALGPSYGAILSMTLQDALEQLKTDYLEIPYKLQRWEKAKALSWEVEAEKLLHLLT